MFARNDQDGRLYPGVCRFQTVLGKTADVLLDAKHLHEAIWGGRIRSAFSQRDLRDYHADQHLPLRIPDLRSEVWSAVGAGLWRIAFPQYVFQIRDHRPLV